MLNNFFLAIIVFCTMPTYAKWVEKNDAQIKVLQRHREVYIRKDGTSEVLFDDTYEIISERARQEMSIFKISYNGVSEEFKLIHAYIKNGKKTYRPEKSKMENKELSSGGQGFDSFREVKIPFPKLKIGSKVFIKYKINKKIADLPNFYSSAFFFLGYSNAFTYSQKLTITSEKPLYIDVADRDHLIEVKKYKSGGKYKLAAKLKRPSIRDFTNESSTVYSERLWPVVGVSTIKNWSSFSREYLKAIKGRFVESLPEKLKKIVDRIKNKKTMEHHFSELLNQIIQEFNYVGDWRTVQGAFVPRSLKEITQTHYGDCKDFSLLTVRILRQLGYDAGLALVYRSSIPVIPRPSGKIPMLGLFNHMIVYVKEKGKVHYLDATNDTVYSSFLNPDIENRYVLLLDDKVSQLQEIGINDIGVHGIDIKVVFQKKKRDEIQKAKVKIHFLGHEANNIMSYQLSDNRSDFGSRMLSWFFKSEKITDHKLDKYKGSVRRIPKKGLFFDLSVQGASASVETNLGQGISDTSLLGEFTFVYPGYLMKDRVNDLWLGKRETFKRRVYMPVVNKKIVLPKDCGSQNDYFEVNRRYRYIDNSIERFDFVRVKRSVVPVSLLKKPSFRKQVMKAWQCSKSVILISQPQQSEYQL